MGHMGPTWGGHWAIQAPSHFLGNNILLAIPRSIVLEHLRYQLPTSRLNLAVDRPGVAGGGSSIDRCGDASSCIDEIGVSRPLAPPPQPLAGVNLGRSQQKYERVWICNCIRRGPGGASLLQPRN